MQDKAACIPTGKCSQDKMSPPSLLHETSTHSPDAGCRKKAGSPYARRTLSLENGVRLALNMTTVRRM
jgi:hypothetical protein